MDDLKKICQQYFDKWYSLEGEMFFLQREVILRDLQINELTISVSDEGQVHQAYPEEGLQIREQVRQAAGEGCQVCLCQPAEAVQGLRPPSSVTMTDSIQGRRSIRPLLDDFIQFCHCHVLLVSLLLLLPSFSTKTVAALSLQLPLAAPTRLAGAWLCAPVTAPDIFEI